MVGEHRRKAGLNDRFAKQPVDSFRQAGK